MWCAFLPFDRLRLAYRRTPGILIYLNRFHVFDRNRVHERLMPLNHKFIGWVNETDGSRFDPNGTTVFEPFR